MAIGPWCVTYYAPGGAVHGLGGVLCGGVATTRRGALEKVNLEAHSWPNKTGRRGWGTKKKRWGAMRPGVVVGGGLGDEEKGWVAFWFVSCRCRLSGPFVGFFCLPWVFLGCARPLLSPAGVVLAVRCPAHIPCSRSRLGRPFSRRLGGAPSGQKVCGFVGAHVS